MKAYLRSVRIAPKKASLIAKMIRGRSVPEAMSMLEHTHKKGARIMEKLLRSAMANASHNAKQDPQMMIVKTLVVNQGQAYHRGVPMARGRVRPIRKFLSHIELTLGFPGDDLPKAGVPASKKAAKSGADASQEQEKTVQKKRSASGGAKKSTGSKGKSQKETAASDSPSSRKSSSTKTS